MYVTLNDVLDDDIKNSIQGCIHCTNVRSLCDIMLAGEISCSNAVREEQKNKKVPYFIRTRDVNKSGADGVLLLMRRSALKGVSRYRHSLLFM